MKYYYVAVVGGDIWDSSPSLERLMEMLIQWEKSFKGKKVQIIAYEEKEILKWPVKN